MNSFSFKADSISLEVQERDNQGRWSFQREFVETKNKSQFVSDRILNSNFVGGTRDTHRRSNHLGYYYMQDGLEQQLAKSIVIPSQKFESFRDFILSAIFEKKEMSLQYITNAFILKKFCTSTFDSLKESVLQSHIPESQIEQMRIMYDIKSVTESISAEKFRYFLY
jgi:hypothetical protein